MKSGRTGLQRRHKRIILAIGCIAVMLAAGIAAAQWFEEKLPPLPPASQYGNLLIKRTSSTSDMLPVSFSHWLHRARYTCRVCHVELEFEMKANATDITMDKINNGQYCGACHDGNRAFGQDQCKSCHTGDIKTGSEKFRKVTGGLPKDPYGNQVDWVAAVKKRLIKPKKTIREGELPPVTFKKLLILQAEWNNIPPSIFPHDIHTYWLDCANCHPDVFNIKQKTTKHFLMTYMFEGKFCGACHLNVAFPLNDCKRCHPDIGRGR